MLKKLYLKFGSWKSATGYYHSYRNTRRKKYSAKVFNTLLDIQNKNNFSFIQIAEQTNSERVEYNNLREKLKPLMLVENKITAHTKKNKNDRKKLTHSDYILARMEKVEFFRKYFYENRKN